MVFTAVSCHAIFADHGLDIGFFTEFSKPSRPNTRRRTEKLKDQGGRESSVARKRL